MILMYHKICPESHSMWWVTPDQFHRQMLELRGYEVVYLDDYDPSDPRKIVITFDGVYENVHRFAEPILSYFSFPFELFISGDHVGKNNAFDSVEPPTKFASPKELSHLIASGGRLQWHSKSHKNLKEVLDPEAIEEELCVPADLKALDNTGFKWFAYPHGEFNGVVIDKVKEKFIGALSCNQGNDIDTYRLNRLTVTNDVSIPHPTVSLIIPSYNYGRYLPEAVESALRQTRLPDEILIIDDGSEDDTCEIGENYADSHPRLISFISNKKNLGICETFNKAVSLTRGEYICFLGADNRFRSDYLEKVTGILDTDPQCGIAYTDFALFDQLATVHYKNFPEEWRGPILENFYFIINFPDFSEESYASIRNRNFIHGSSLYRRKAFEAIGGYREREIDQRPEDYNLFLAMIEQGWSAKRAPFPLLEYRQHSNEQANAKFSSYLQLLHYREKVAEQEALLACREAELSDLLQSRSWRVTAPLRWVFRKFEKLK